MIKFEIKPIHTEIDAMRLVKLKKAQEIKIMTVSLLSE